MSILTINQFHMYEKLRNPLLPRLLQALLLMFSLAFTSCSGSKGYVSITGYAQGGTYIVKLDATDSDLSPDRLKSSIDSILNVIDNSLSGYNKSSLVSRFNDGEDITDTTSAEYVLFAKMLDYGDQLLEITGGVVDVWSAPLFDVWGFGFTPDSLPSQSVIDEAMRKSRSHTKLNFNAIAQGYSCDLIADYLFSHNVKSMLVDVGGEIFCSGKNPKGNAWTLGVDSPFDGNMDSGADIKAIMEAPQGRCGIVTSGNYRKYYVKDGRKYAHTIDPLTGYPVQHNLLCATVVSQNCSCMPDALFADGIATYCMAVGLDKAMEFVLADPSLEACLIYDNNGKMELWKSPGFILKHQY